MAKLSEQFPNYQPWPVKPPDEHWLKRWHWLRDEDGFLGVFAWHHRMGWHMDWSGKAEPEIMEGWEYVCPVHNPEEAP